MAASRLASRWTSACSVISTITPARSACSASSSCARGSISTGPERFTLTRVSAGRSATSFSASRRHASSSSVRSPNSSASANQWSGLSVPPVRKRASASNAWIRPPPPVDDRLHHHRDALAVDQARHCSPGAGRPVLAERLARVGRDLLLAAALRHSQCHVGGAEQRLGVAPVARRVRDPDRGGHGERCRGQGGEEARGDGLRVVAPHDRAELVAAESPQRISGPSSSRRRPTLATSSASPAACPFSLFVWPKSSRSISSSAASARACRGSPSSARNAARERVPVRPS